MRKELEYAKKIALVRKLFRAGGLSEAEYNRVRAKLMDMYHVIENDQFVYCLTYKGKDTLLYAYYSLDNGEFLKAYRL